MDFHFRYGWVPSAFGMDNVKCSGTESSILDCPHLTESDCGSAEGAGVVCTDNISK